MGKKAKERKRLEREAQSAVAPEQVAEASTEVTAAEAEPRPPRQRKAAGPRTKPAKADKPAAAAGAPPTAELATRLNSMAIHLLRRLAREDTRLGLSGARLSALSVLIFGGPRTLGKLAEAEGVSPPSMTRLVTAMETEGLVAREKNAADGRSVVIRASHEGERILIRGREQRVEALAGWMSALTGDGLVRLDRATATLEELLRTERATKTEASNRDEPA